MKTRVLLRRRADILMEDLYDLWDQRGVVLQVVHILHELEREKGTPKLVRHGVTDRRKYSGRRARLREEL